MRQSIRRDRHGADTWDETNTGRVYVHIVNSLMYREITGERAPESPVSARAYTESGYPWFSLYDEGHGDPSPSEELAGVSSVKEMDEARGFAPQQDDAPVEVPVSQITPVAKMDSALPVEGGNW